MTLNMIYIVAFGGGLKCLRNIHLNTEWEYYAEIMTAHTFLKLHSELFRTYEFSNLLKSQNRKTPIQL